MDHIFSIRRGGGGGLDVMLALEQDRQKRACLLENGGLRKKEARRMGLKQREVRQKERQNEAGERQRRYRKVGSN